MDIRGNEKNLIKGEQYTKLASSYRMIQNITEILKDTFEKLNQDLIRNCNINGRIRTDLSDKTERAVTEGGSTRLQE